MTQVNGQSIKKELIKQEMENLRPSYEQTFRDMEEKKREEQLYDWSRENLIERVLIEQEASRAVSEVDQEQLEDTYKQMLDRAPDGKLTEQQQEELKKGIEQQMKVKKLLESICDGVDEPSDDEIKEAYESHREEFKSPEEVGVYHIVKHPGGQTSAEAAQKTLQDALEELKAGKKFPEVCNKYSDCPDSGGDLGYFPRGKMVEEFEDVVFNMGEGELSDIFQTRFGYHIAKVYGKKEPRYLDLEEVKGHIVSLLKDEKKRKKVEDFVDELKEKADIVRD